MKKILVLVTIIGLCVTSTIASDASVGVSAGYNNQYVVNGVARSNDSAFVGVTAYKETEHIDVYFNGILLPDSAFDQSHWTAGLSKTVFDLKYLDVKVSADATRHQSGVIGVPNSTEFGAKLTLDNDYLVPYVRYTSDIDLDQSGWFAGVYRVQPLPLGFTVTPLVEYGQLDDYTAVAAKVTLARPIKNVTPFVEVGWLDNDFDVTNYNFATREYDGDITLTAGINVVF